MNRALRRPSGQAPPSRPAGSGQAFSRLLAILEEETKRGYLNTAVIGGLDTYLANLSDAIKGDHAPLMPSPSYASLSPGERREWAEKVRRWLDTPEKARPPLPTSTTPPKSRSSTSAKPDRELTLGSPLSMVSGARANVTAKLGKLGVKTIRDVLYFFPRRHQDFSQRKAIADLEPGSEQTVVGIIWDVAERNLGRKKSAEAAVMDDTGMVRAVWFNQPYLARQLKPQARVVLSGSVSVFRDRLVFENPEYELIDSEEEELVHTGRLVPVYPLTEGLFARQVRRLVKGILDHWVSALPDTLPLEIRARAGLLPLPQAVVQAHYPDSLQNKEAARRRLAFDELLLAQLVVLARKRQWQAEGGHAFRVREELLEGFCSSLPFSLTSAQERALREVLGDLALPRPMIRLLQGDVGSGKTVVALASLLVAVDNRYQGAIMAPTEILAEQHYRNICSALGGGQGESPLENGTYKLPYLSGKPEPLKVGLLTGSMRPEIKDELKGMAADGTLDILVGTHALIQEGVAFRQLGLAVIDEQHRFGVTQRFTLRQKGGNPHLLVMSATPIPRTMALTLYGDLDLSVIDELPPGRQPVDTRWLLPRQRKSTYEFLRKEVQGGRQAFIICPLIEESEKLAVKAAIAEHHRLSREIFPELRLGLLHGRMSGPEKDRAMIDFQDGKLDVLVSTSVVEVGIDVPNATVMLIEGADRFGLAQLHQFRGRVGRGPYQSYCLLLSESPSDEARERLSLVERIQDGFVLAEEDLRLRGPGEFLGTRQSGLPDLRMARLSDTELLDMARKEATTLSNKDPALEAPQHRALAEQVAHISREGRGDIS